MSNNKPIDFGPNKPALDDSGPIAMRIGHLPNGDIRIEFGRSVAWLNLEPAQAEHFASSILKLMGKRFFIIPDTAIPFSDGSKP